MSENRSPNCCECPVQSIQLAAKPAIVRLSKDGRTWLWQESNVSVHLVALFRDPGIKDGRTVEYVLDLRSKQDNSVQAGINCWVKNFLNEMPGLPPGLTVALDNGVRCRCPVSLGPNVYEQRASFCHRKTEAWFGQLRHPDGGKPGIVLCDKDLTYSLKRLSLLLQPQGRRWDLPRQFLDLIGSAVVYLGADAVVLAHPVMFTQRYQSRYAAAFKDRKIVHQLIQLARMSPLSIELIILPPNPCVHLTADRPPAIRAAFALL